MPTDHLKMFALQERLSTELEAQDLITDDNSEAWQVCIAQHLCEP